jgi:hypothetical protein
MLAVSMPPERYGKSQALGFRFNNPFNAATLGVDTEANSFGVQAQARLTPGLILAGWVNYIDAEAKGNNVLTGSIANPVVNSGDNADIWSWSVGLAFPDLFKEGSLAGFIFGMPPKVTDSDYGARAAAANAPRVKTMTRLTT